LRLHALRHSKLSLDLSGLSCKPDATATRQEFKGLVADVIREEFNLGLRHDVPGENGKQRHGWFDVRLDHAAVFGRN
jgi:hypothetical protein